MNIIKQSAECLHGSLISVVNPTKHEDFVDIMNLKTVGFNLSTLALIACVALGILGSLSAATTLILGGCFLLGRMIIEESYSVFLPGWVIKLTTPDFFKPAPLLRIGGVVIFYKTSSVKASSL